MPKTPSRRLDIIKIKILKEKFIVIYLVLKKNL